MTKLPAPVPAVHDTAPPRHFGPITKTDIVRYAGASGDYNPLHHDEEFARSAGHPSIFAMGMFQAGLLGTFMSDWLAGGIVRQFQVRFREQVWPDDVLTCRGVVTRVQEDEAGRRVHVDLTCERQTGGVAIAGSAIVEL
jgi:acyl dehydratase